MRIVTLLDRISQHERGTVSFFRDSEWVQRSFRDLRDDVLTKSAELAARGLRPRMHVGLVCSNCYEWLVTELALVTSGALVVPVTESVVAEKGWKHVAQCNDLDIALLLGSPPDGAAVPLWVTGANDDSVFVRHLNERKAATGRQEDLFHVLSSGTTGRSKTIRVNKEGFEAAVESLARVYDLSEEDSTVLFLPASNLQQRLIAYGALFYGISLTLTEPLRLIPALQKGRPTIILGPPAFYETVLQQLSSRRFVSWLLGLLVSISASNFVRPMVRVLLRPFGRLVARALGGKVRLLITGMAPIRRRTLMWYRALSLPLYEAYGMTEFGIIAANTSDAARDGSVGRPSPDVQIDFDGKGQVLARRVPPLTTGYIDEPQLNEQTYLRQDWLATGDIGFMDEDGYLHLRGRLRNVVTATDGTKVHPEVIEEELLASPHIGQCALVYLDDQTLCCVLVPSKSDQRSFEAARNFASVRMEQLASFGRVDLVMKADGFSPSNGLLTSNLKLNRQAIADWANTTKNLRRAG